MSQAGPEIEVEYDFEYDGRTLSGYGFMMCDFSGGGSIEEVEAGAKITFVTVPRNGGAKHGLVNAKYESGLTCSFDICLNPCLVDSMELTQSDIRDIMRWLNRREFLPFHFIGDDTFDCYFNASFNVMKLVVDGKVYGLRLEMETDAPYGYGDELTFTWSAAAANYTYRIMNQSDEIGYLYPTLSITVRADCDFTITNDTFGGSSVIKNCKTGETITMYGDTNIIETDRSGHDICDDFNYEFFRIGNNMTEQRNMITVSHPCSVTLKYRPVIKGTLQ